MPTKHLYRTPGKRNLRPKEKSPWTERIERVDEERREPIAGDGLFGLGCEVWTKQDDLVLWAHDGNPNRLLNRVQRYSATTTRRPRDRVPTSGHVLHYPSSLSGNALNVELFPWVFIYAVYNRVLHDRLE